MKFSKLKKNMSFALAITFLFVGLKAVDYAADADVDLQDKAVSKFPRLTSGQARPDPRPDKTSDTNDIDLTPSEAASFVGETNGLTVRFNVVGDIEQLKTGADSKPLVELLSNFPPNYQLKEVNDKAFGNNGNGKEYVYKATKIAETAKLGLNNIKLKITAKDGSQSKVGEIFYFIYPVPEGNEVTVFKDTDLSKAEAAKYAKRALKNADKFTELEESFADLATNSAYADKKYDFAKGAFNKNNLKYIFKGTVNTSTVGKQTATVTVSYPKHNNKTVTTMTKETQVTVNVIEKPSLAGTASPVTANGQEQVTGFKLLNGTDKTKVTVTDANGNVVNSSVDTDGTIKVTPENNNCVGPLTITVTMTEPELEPAITQTVPVKPYLSGTAKKIPADGREQTTDLMLLNKTDQTQVKVTDKHGNAVASSVDSSNGTIKLTAKVGTEGPLKVTVTDPLLGDKNIEQTIELQAPDALQITSTRRQNGDWVVTIKDAQGNYYPKGSTVAITKDKNDLSKNINGIVVDDAGNVTISNSKLPDAEIKDQQITALKNSQISAPSQIAVPAKQALPSSQILELAQGTTADKIDPKLGIANFADIPNSDKVQKVEFTQQPDTSQIADAKDYEATITYQDGSTSTIKIPVKIVAKKTAPQPKPNDNSSLRPLPDSEYERRQQADEIDLTLKVNSKPLNAKKPYTVAKTGEIANSFANILSLSLLAAGFIIKIKQDN